MLGVGALLASGSPGRFPNASLAHKIAFDVPFEDNDRMPPGDEVPNDAVAVPRPRGLAPK